MNGAQQARPNDDRANFGLLKARVKANECLGSRSSAGHRALEGALAGGSLREPRQVVPQIRRELIRKTDALRESQRAPDKYVSYREALADEIVAAILSWIHRATVWLG
jgi:hypothetical protein